MKFTDFTCNICGNTTGNTPFIATELMLGLGDDFEYFECSKCLCLQIRQIPSDMARYYSNGYYSFQQPTFPTKLTGFRYFLKKSLAGYYSGSFNLTGWLISPIYGNPFTWLKPGIVNFDSKVLDVGCGSGRLLLSMKRSGYKNLTGIDPYNPEDIFYENGVKVFKKEISEIGNTYDLVMLHHSFEHMDNPQVILKRLVQLIAKDGHIIIRIPVANCFAWRKYKTFWVQLDAPRHFFLHTVESMKILAGQAGLKIKYVDYESTYFQFTGSEKYLKGLKFSHDISMFSKDELKKYRSEAKKLNQLNDGDSACFYLQKA